MSRKHYEAVAAEIREAHAHVTAGMDTLSVQLTAANRLRAEIARGMARVFAEDNPRFDRARFLAACGL